MTTLYEAAKQALAFTMRDFASLRDFEAAKAVLQDTIRSALVEEEKAAAWLAERKEYWRKEREKMQATDPELSAALGWPGGTSDPVLDRTRLLQMVAALRVASKQALEALEWHYRQGHSNTLGGLRLKIDEKALRNLRAALAQQPKPVAWVECDGELVWNNREAAIGRNLYTTPPQRPPLADEEIDKATAQERDALLDHIYEYGTAAEGVLERIRRLARAVERKVRGE